MGHISNSSMTPSQTTVGSTFSRSTACCVHGEDGKEEAEAAAVDAEEAGAVVSIVPELLPRQNLSPAHPR